MANELHDLLSSLDLEAPPALSGGAEPGGWPVEPADIGVVDPQGTVAVCTLGDAPLALAVADAARGSIGRRTTIAGDPAGLGGRGGVAGLAVAGPMATENIGVEKLVRNVLASPAIDSIVLCGPETGGAAPTGHYAGDALLCLLRHGVDGTTRRIAGARGRRPFVRNLLPGEVDGFRRRVRLLDLRGEGDPAVVLAALADDASAWLQGLPPYGGGGSPSTARPRATTARARAVTQVRPVCVETVPAASTGYVADPAGYVLIFADAPADRLVLEHYTADGRRTAVLVGRDPGSLAHAAIERGMVGRLDHAAYLGRELARARAALDTKAPYVQDAPEAGG